MDYRSRIVSVIQEWEEECAALKRQARESGSKLELANAGLLAMIAKKDARIADLEIEHKKLLDEYQSFMSVSRVVAISNENAKLRERVALLERCSRNKVPAPEPKEESPPEDAPKADPEEDAPNAEDPKEDVPVPEAEINVYEKKIKGVMYYIDEADNIYEQLEDGAMGDIKGRYVPGANNKRKIEWM